MYQTVGHEGITLIAQCLDVPLFTAVLRGTSLARDRDYIPTEGDEVEDLAALLQSVQVRPGASEVLPPSAPAYRPDQPHVALVVRSHPPSPPLSGCIMVLPPSESPPWIGSGGSWGDSVRLPARARGTCVWHGTHGAWLGGVSILIRVIKQGGAARGRGHAHAGAAACV